jgi:hypothetical protein
MAEIDATITDQSISLGVSLRRYCRLFRCFGARYAGFRCLCFSFRCFPLDLDCFPLRFCRLILAPKRNFRLALR